MRKHLRFLAIMLLLTVCGGVWADEETFDFVGWNFDGASSWTTAYTMRTVTGTAATVVFANANKQPTFDKSDGKGWYNFFHKLFVNRTALGVLSIGAIAGGLFYCYKYMKLFRFV